MDPEDNLGWWEAPLEISNTTSCFKQKEIDQVSLGLFQWSFEWSPKMVIPQHLCAPVPGFDHPRGEKEITCNGNFPCCSSCPMPLCAPLRNSWHYCVRWLQPAVRSPSAASLRLNKPSSLTLFVNATFSFSCNHPGGRCWTWAVLQYKTNTGIGNARIGKVAVIRVTRIALRFMIIYAVEVTSVFWVDC